MSSQVQGRVAISDSRWLCTAACRVWWEAAADTHLHSSQGSPTAVPGSIPQSVRKMRKGVRERNSAFR